MVVFGDMYVITVVSTKGKFSLKIPHVEFYYHQI